MSLSTTLRDQLLQLQAELHARISRIQAEQTEHRGTDQQMWSDQGRLHERDDEQFALKLAAQVELQHIQQALLRLEQGTYGQCSICGEPIDTQRLQAIPFATRCMQHVDEP